MRVGHSPKARSLLDGAWGKGYMNPTVFHAFCPQDLSRYESYKIEKLLAVRMGRYLLVVTSDFGHNGTALGKESLNKDHCLSSDSFVHSLGSSGRFWNSRLSGLHVTRARARLLRP